MTSNDRADGPAGYLHSVIRCPTALTGGPGVGNNFRPFEVDQREIRVVSKRDAPFRREPEDAGWTIDAKVNEALKRQPAFSDMIQHHRNQGLNTPASRSDFPDKVGPFPRVYAARDPIR